MSDMRLYAFPLGAHRGDLGRKKSCLTGDLEIADLISEEFSDSMYFYYEWVRRNGEVKWGRLLEFKSVLRGREGCRICLERIFATGLSQEEYGRYYYSENF